MPEVAGKKFPYTAKGKDQAAQYRKRLKKKKKSVKKEGRSVKTMGGKYVGSLGSSVAAKKAKPTPNETQAKEPKESKESKMPKKKKKSDQSKQSVKRRAAAKEGSWRRKGVGRAMTSAEERYYSGKRTA